jgi:iron complex transport system substrate-binding protein
LRIVTLLPSATEIVCALGLREYLVGVSHSCNYPEDVSDLPVVTSTHVPYNESSQVIDDYVREHLTGHEALYDLDMEQLIALQPDFIISQTLCDVCAVSTGDVAKAIESLPSQPTLIDLNPNTLDDVFADVRNVGERLGIKPEENSTLLDLIARRDAVAARTATVPPAERPSVAFLEWIFPPFNGGHWNPELVHLAGGIDLLGAPGKASSTQDWQEIIAKSPDIVFVSCCGFHVERALQDLALASETDEWQQISAVKKGRVYVTDGNAYFSCPGPRLIDGLEIMAHALHPNVHPKLWPQEPAQP